MNFWFCIQHFLHSIHSGILQCPCFNSTFSFLFKSTFCIQHSLFHSTQFMFVHCDCFGSTFFNSRAHFAFKTFYFLQRDLFSFNNLLHSSWLEEICPQVFIDTIACWYKEFSAWIGFVSRCNCWLESDSPLSIATTFRDVLCLHQD